MEMFERLRAARKRAGFMSGSAAAAALRVPVGTYLGHENGQRSFDVDTAKRYAKKFGVTTSWLLTEEGPMVYRDRDSQIERIPIEDWDPAAPEVLHAGPNYSAATDYQPSLPGGRPEIDVRAGAGFGTIGEEVVVAIASGDTAVGHKVVSEWVLPEDFYRHELRAGPSTTIILPIIGDSMLPTLSPGDRAIVDLQQNTLSVDAIYVFDDGSGEPQVKRLSKVLFSDPDQVTVISDNPMYPQQTVSRRDVRIIGRVVGRVTRL